jgi:hypothetical protein
MLDNIPTLRAGRRQSDELPELSGRNFKIEPAIRHAKLDVRKEKTQNITLLPIRKRHKTPQMFSIPARCRSTSNCSKKMAGRQPDLGSSIPKPSIGPPACHQADWKAGPNHAFLHFSEISPTLKPKK